MKLYVYIAIGVIVFGSLTGIYYSWRKGIEREALLEYNQEQIEQNLKDQEAMRKRLEDIKKSQEEFIKKNAADKKEFNDKIGNITRGIDSEPSSDRPASDVLKKTVDQLRKIPK